MFIAAIIVLPLAGFAAGWLGKTRKPADVLAALCILLGAAGALWMGLDSDTIERGSSVAFSAVAGLAAALLVYGGWLVSRRLHRLARVRPEA
jgi:drug/metabolite transporter (DMT)-like permease